MIQRLLSNPRTRPLSADEQLRLGKQYRQTKDPGIEKKLVETNLRRSCAARKAGRSSCGRCREPRSLRRISRWSDGCTSQTT
jgi:hypothetical protein